jgi:iron complex transport system ATP-binding protein
MLQNARGCGNASSQNAPFCACYTRAAGFALSLARPVPLSAAHLSFSYAKASRRTRDSAPLAVDDVSLDVAAGALVGILGPNGSGKTTLLKLLAGSLTPNQGTVALDGQDVSTMPARDRARRVAVVPQETHLAFDYSVLEIALMGRYPYLGPFEVEGPDDLAAAMAGLEATGTARLADRPFQHLSGGEKQRVIIASALAQLGNRESSRVLFLDEPTASLDLKYQLEVAALVRRLHDHQHVTIVLSTHDLRFAASICSEIVMLSSGRVLAHGLPRDVLTRDAIARLYEIDLAAAPVVV